MDGTEGYKAESKEYWSWIKGVKEAETNEAKVDVLKQA